MNALCCTIPICALVAFTACSTLPETAPSTSTEHPAVESFLRDMVQDTHFSGVALVIQDGRIAHAKGYGNATHRRENDRDTAYHVASVTKQVTAAAVMQLVERGAVDLHGSINEFLPERYRSSRWSAVTVHHLLSQCSGIPDYVVTRDYYELSDGFANARTVDRMIAEAMQKGLEFEPGAKYAYSNIGYVLLGKIVEQESGESFANYVEKNVLEPMGMRASLIRPDAYVPAANHATGFRWSEKDNAFMADKSETLPATPADAGLITTLDDFARWVRVYTGGHQPILTQESINAMTRQQTRMGRGGSVDAYGYGLGVGDRLIAHSGHVVGFRSQFILDRQTDTAIAVFSNNSAVDMNRVAFGLLTVLFAHATGPGVTKGR